MISSHDFMKLLSDVETRTHEAQVLEERASYNRDSLRVLQRECSSAHQRKIELLGQFDALGIELVALSAKVCHHPLAIGQASGDIWS